MTAPAFHVISRGLSLPIAGEPVSQVDRAATGRTVGVHGADYVGLKPMLHVRVGDAVKRGQLLFEDKTAPGVRFTAAAAGRISAIHRGPKRAFESLVIEISDRERDATSTDVEAIDFASFRGTDPRDLGRDAIVALLLESGQWTALRARPFSRVASPADRPDAVFVTAIDTQPHAPAIDVVLAGRDADLERGLHVLAKLTEGPVFVCTDRTTVIPVPASSQFRLERFVGPHPAGTVGLHIHRLHPVDRTRTVWHLGVQDLLAIGALFGTGRLDVERIVSLAGPAIRRPRLLRTRLGACVDTLCEGEVSAGEVRLISGSVLSGRKARGEVHGFLGRFHQQITAIHEQREREFLGWLAPPGPRVSATPTILSKLFGPRKLAFGSSTAGSRRAIVPIGVYEKVLPMDLEPTLLLKAIMMRDAEWAERLGCLELDEEDVALCSFVCPGKSDFGPHLREVLTILEQEGA